MTDLPAVTEQPAEASVEALDEFGLTAKQRVFCDHLLAGASSPSEAARSAGCKGDYARVYATRTIRSRAVQEYIRQSVGHTMAIGSVKALTTMLSLLGDRSGQVRYWAARDVLDRTGFMAQPSTPQAPAVTINIDLS